MSLYSTNRSPTSGSNRADNKQIQNMVNNNILKPNNSFKEKKDNFGIDASENAFKKTLRNNNIRLNKEEEKFNPITNLPIKPLNSINTININKNNLTHNKKEIFSNYETANKLIFDESTEKILNSNSKKTQSYSMKASSVKEYGYSENQNDRFRNYMEDFCKVVDKFMGDKTKGIYALFDGHGGSDVVLYVKDRFADLFSYYFYNTKSNVEQSYINAFRKIDEEISKASYSENMGCTACVVFVSQENNLISGMQKVLYSANLGDTRAVIISKNLFKKLTVDHKCIDKEEHNRIKNWGGVIIEGKIFGQLILSRALGDMAFKKYGVSCIRFTTKYVITEKDLFLVLASNGVL